MLFVTLHFAGKKVGPEMSAAPDRRFGPAFKLRGNVYCLSFRVMFSIVCCVCPGQQRLQGGRDEVDVMIENKPVLGLRALRFGDRNFLLC